MSGRSINDLPTLTRQKLCRKLDIRSDIGGDFRTLAGCLDMGIDDLDLISQMTNPTHRVLRWWGRNPKHTVAELREILLQMGRSDCVEIIDENPETGRDKCVMHVEEHDDLNTNINNFGAPPQINLLEYMHLNPDRVDGPEISQRQIDVLLLTVTDTEFLAAYKILPSPEVADAGELGPIYFGKIGRNSVALLKMAASSINVAGPLTTSLGAIEQFSPSVIFSIGVCFGMNCKNVKLGDILVAAKMGFYAPVRINRTGEQVSRGPLIECNARLWRLFENGKVGWSGPCEERQSKIHVGLVISGPEIIENPERKEQLQSLYPEALGGEQQGEGLYSICEPRKLPWLVCKGVADWADGNNNENWQPFAATAAASYVEHVMLENYIPGKK